MAKATLREIMKRGHQLAKKMEGDYQARIAYGLKVAWAEYKNKEDESVNGTPQVVKNTQGQDRKVSLCVEIRDGNTKTYPTKEQLKKEGCKWTTSGISSNWTLVVSDKEEAKVKYLEYKNRGYICDIKVTDGTIHLPILESNKIWGTEFSRELFRELGFFKRDN